MRFRENRVLVTDDEEFCIASMKAMISKVGLDVQNRLDVCFTGLQMINLVKQSYEIGITYKLIFTDISMPGMDGIEAVKQIRDHFKSKGIPREKQPYIIGVTGHCQDKFSVLGIKAGMDEVIAKPLYFKTML